MIWSRTDSYKDLYTTGYKGIRQWMMVKFKKFAQGQLLRHKCHK